MKKGFALLCLLFPLLLIAQQDTISSGVYDWMEPINSATGGASMGMFQGAAHDLKWLEVNAHDLYATQKNKPVQFSLSDSQECVVIIKSGKLKLQLKDSSYMLSTGSVILLMPGEQYAMQALQKTCSYYTLTYASRQLPNTGQGKASGGYQVVNWDTVTFKSGDKGGRRDFLNRPTALSRRVEIHASTLKPGFKSHDPHTHIAPEIVIVTEGQTEMQIGNQFYPGTVGSVYFLASNNLHAIQNKGNGNCTYFAIQLE